MQTYKQDGNEDIGHSLRSLLQPIVCY